jgi:hypothetical protein
MKNQNIQSYIRVPSQKRKWQRWKFHVLSIFNLLERYEPGVNTDLDKLELEIEPLRVPTLNALRAKVDKCLGVNI